MNRRQLLSAFAALGVFRVSTAAAARPGTLKLSDAEWRSRLTAAQYDVLRHEGTEPAFSSQLNAEKRPGTYVCAGCDLPLFSSAMKYDSGTGWPSFTAPLPEAIGVKS